jgi:hypothetical protein
VSSNGSVSRLPSITVRPTPAEKERFAALAASRGMSESALALMAIRSLLECKDVSEADAAPGRRERSTDRITIRLRPGDRRAINERANRRDMKASTYLAALVRAHVATNPPLTENELDALKRGVIILGGLGRLLTRMFRDGARAGSMPKEFLEQLSLTRTMVAALEKVTSNLVCAALKSWESGYD